MKTHLLIPLLAVACTGFLCAETPDTNAKRPPEPTPELRQRFEAARDTAMKDPKIQELKKTADQANATFRKAMREAMIQADPGLAEIIKDRIKDGMKDGKKDGKKEGVKDRMKKDGKAGDRPGFGNLSDADRQKLMAAREQAKNDPAVQAAETLKQNAKTPEERQAAMEQFHKAMKAALLKADPTLGPILDQMKPQGGHHKGEQGDKPAA